MATDSSWVASFSEWNIAATPESLGVSFAEAVEAMSLAQTRARVADERFSMAHSLALLVWRGWVRVAQRNIKEDVRRARRRGRRLWLRKAWMGWQRLRRRQLRVCLGDGLMAFEKPNGWDMHVDASAAPPTAKLISFLRRPKCVNANTDALWQAEAQRCWSAAPIARWNTVFLDKNGYLFIGDTFSRYHIKARLAALLEQLGCNVTEQ